MRLDTLAIIPKCKSRKKNIKLRIDLMCFGLFVFRWGLDITGFY